ncbi:MAG: hypothetical protein GF308_06275 [Candidatus Heimdallarchaeota archaeon]|nr:hypothetical protein [Candidatus Heimdallarchaeota archaeon]
MTIYIRLLGHVAFQLKTANKIIYIDPSYMKKFGEQVGYFFDNPEKAV